MKIDDLLDMQKRIISAYALLNALNSDAEMPSLLKAIVQAARNDVSSVYLDLNRKVEKRLHKI
jgi:predicted transcriptional regulator